MVSPRLFFVFALLVVCLQCIYSAPLANPSVLGEREDLVERFAEFLHEDKELAKVLQNLDWDEGQLSRNKRQAGTTTQGLDSEEYDPPQEKPGFFDRAAKFVTELLQRFLKWVNNSENN